MRKSVRGMEVIMEYKFTTQDFEQEVLKADKPVLVDFYADWCGPCKMMAPLVSTLAGKYEGKLKVGKCNIDENADLANKYKIMSIPTMKVFENGEVKTTIVGAMSQEELETEITKVL